MAAPVGLLRSLAKDSFCCVENHPSHPRLATTTLDGLQGLAARVANFLVLIGQTSYFYVQDTVFLLPLRCVADEAAAS